MDETIRADNDFRQRREEAYRFYEMTRGFRGRLHPKHVRSIHNSNANDERANNAQNNHHGSQSLSMQQTSYRPPASRCRGGRSFSEGRFDNQPRKLFRLLVVRTRVTQQGRARSRSRNKRKLLKLRRGRISRSRSSILLRATLHRS
jgi:hypothetical protein